MDMDVAGVGSNSTAAKSAVLLQQQGCERVVASMHGYPVTTFEAFCMSRHLLPGQPDYDYI
jgi:hypothetical protein